ncbi:MAG: hypothetical protein ACI80N_003295, partial [Gammaproteobacteria bacterium]
SKGNNRSTSRKVDEAPSASSDEIEVLEEEAGLSMEDGIAIVTGIMLIIAILMVDYELGSSYGTGVFF